MKRAERGLTAGQACGFTAVFLAVMLAVVMHASGHLTGISIREQLHHALFVEADMLPEEAPRVQVISALAEAPAAAPEDPEIPEDFENLYIEQALIEQGYYRDDIPLPYEMQDHMQSACDIYGVPYALALAVCETESTFDPEAQDGFCYGYMQLHSVNHERLRELTGYDVTTPAGNIVGGVYMLGELLEKYGNIEKALCCYNAGEAGAEKRYFSKGLISTEYTRKVLARMEAWEAVLYG